MQKTKHSSSIKNLQSCGIRKALISDSVLNVTRQCYYIRHIRSVFEMTAGFSLCSDSPVCFPLIGTECPLGVDGCLNGSGCHGDGEHSLGERRIGAAWYRCNLGQSPAFLGEHGESYKELKQHSFLELKNFYKLS